MDELVACATAVQRFTEAMGRIRGGYSTISGEMAQWTDFIKSQDELLARDPFVAQVFSDLSRVLAETRPGPVVVADDDTSPQSVRSSGRFNVLRRLRDQQVSPEAHGRPPALPRTSSGRMSMEIDPPLAAGAFAPRETGLACDMCEEDNIGFRLE